MNIVEQELYFLFKSPGDTCKKLDGHFTTGETPTVGKFKGVLSAYVIHVIAFPFLAH